MTKKVEPSPTPKFIDKFVVETLFTDFYFSNVGYEICDPNHSHGPALRENYLIHYIAKGKGVFKTQGVTYSLAEGNFFLLRPNELGFYQADEADPWTYYWFGFDGIQAEEILRLNGIFKQDAVGKASNQAQILPLFQEIIATDLLAAREKLRLQGLFKTLFSHFTIDENTQITQNVAHQPQRYSELFLMYVQNNYDRDFVTITEIAASMNLNSSYLTQVIKSELKMTPSDYLTEYRINKGKVLLSTSDLSVYEVAARVGYKSSDTFSRMFKQKVGCSPSDFAKKYKK